MNDNFLEFAKSRRSIRKYDETEIPKEDIEYFINAASTAPSGCNSQCWHFIAVKSKDLIKKLSDIVELKVKDFYKSDNINMSDEYLKNKSKSITFFKNAPLVILVFMNHLEYYDKKGIEFFKAEGYSYREMMDFLSFPDVLSIGAAVQNMLLAIHEKGYGACWMNDPVIAEKEIKSLFEISDELRLISIIPVGKSAYNPRDKELKPLKTVLEIK